MSEQIQSHTAMLWTEPGLTLWSLAGPDPELGGQAVGNLMRLARDGERSELDISDALKQVIEREWNALGRYGRHLVTPLAEILRQDEGLMRIELAAMALALQGEDGIAELLELLGSDDFVLRHISVAGLGLLDQRGWWAVPKLLRLLAEEPQPLVSINIVQALGRIGGTGAVAALATLYKESRESGASDTLLTEALERALSKAAAASK